MNRLINKKRIIIGMVLSSMMFVGCGNKDISNNTNTTQSTKVEQNKNTTSNSEKIDLISVLNNAKKIEVKEKLVSIGAGYDVYADDVHVGEIKGKYINLTGDVFELKDLNGNVVKSEKQIKRWNLKLNRMAEVYDKDKNISGYIGEERIKDMFSWGYKFHFYDKDKNEIGYTDQKVLSFTDTFKVYDMNKNLDYVIKGELISLTSSYDIEVNDTSDVKAEDVVFYTAIQNEITRADKKKSKNKTKKVSNIVNSAVATGVVNNVTNKTTTTSSSNKAVATYNITPSTVKPNNKINLTKDNASATTSSKVSLVKDNNASVSKNTSNKNNSSTINKATTSNRKPIGSSMNSSYSNKYSSSSSAKKTTTSKTSSFSSKRRR